MKAQRPKKAGRVKRNFSAQTKRRCPMVGCGREVHANPANGVIERHKNAYGNKCQGGNT